MYTSLPILTFHSIDDQRPAISFSAKSLDRGLAMLSAQGYRALDLVDAVERLPDGIPFARSFVITFDDGYESVYSEAFPLLQRYGMPATVFLTVGDQRTVIPEARLPSLNGRPMLAWMEIREMHESGIISFGAHTLTHPDLTSLPAERIESEIRDSRSIIEDALGCRVGSFAYPFGRYDARCREIASRHFDCACSDRLGLTSSASDPYALERVDAYYLRTDQFFDLMSSRFFPAYIWSRSIPRLIRRALSSRRSQNPTQKQA